MRELARERRRPAAAVVGDYSQTRAANGATAPGVASLLALQRTAGNAAVARLAAPQRTVQRHGDQPGDHTVTPEEQADMPSPADAPALLAENKELYAKKAAIEKATREAAKRGETVKDEDKRLSATDEARRQELDRKLKLRIKGDEAETLRINKQGSAADWFAKVKTTTFLGQSVTVHELLAARLKDAEAALKSEKPPTPDGWIAESTSTLRAPGNSLHSFGLAIDINPGRNPHLVDPNRSKAPSVEANTGRTKAIRDIIDRAVLLVLGKTSTEADLQSRPQEADPTKRVEASYDKLRAASDALERYLKLGKAENRKDLDDLLTKLGSKDTRTADQWIAQIGKDAKSLPTHAKKKEWMKPETGFLHIDRRLVKALTGPGGLTWLGDDVVASGRDIMHFDMRGLGPIHSIRRSAENTTIPLGKG